MIRAVRCTISWYEIERKMVIKKSYKYFSTILENLKILLPAYNDLILKVSQEAK